MSSVCFKDTIKTIAKKKKIICPSRQEIIRSHFNMLGQIYEKILKFLLFKMKCTANVKN